MRAIWLLLVLVSLPAMAEPTQSFSAWLADLKVEATREGIEPALFDKAFATIKGPNETVLERDRTQPEKTKAFSEYVKGLMTDQNIATGRTFWASNRQLFNALDKSYGVRPSILIALWAIESQFGNQQGHVSEIEALSTLAYEGRRTQFFRTQLIDALKIIKWEHIDPVDMTGSWAGAMGQVQFMPSSYLDFAVDYDGNGRKDIWNSIPDALASMANYLQKKGWDSKTGWGMHVTLPPASVTPWQYVKDEKTLKEWERMGVRHLVYNTLHHNWQNIPLTDSNPGQKFTDSNLGQKARLILPDNNPDDAYLVFANYNVLMDWNHSTYFATAVGLLSDAIEDRSGE